MFNVLNSMVNRVFTIPVGGMSRQIAEEQLGKIIAEYSDEVSFNEEFGLVTMQGSPHLKYNKDFWFTEGESGKPSVENLEFKGHDLNSSDMLTWFFNALKRATKIPFGRFDKTNGGGNIYGDISEMSRDELHFFTFIQRLRTVFKEIIIKPWKIKMILDFPELAKDDNFLSKIDVEFNGANLFHEWKKLNNMTKRAGVITSLSGLKGGDDKPFFAIEYLIRTIMKLSDDELRENAMYKKLSGTGSAEGEGADIGMGGLPPDMGGGGMGGGMGGGGMMVPPGGAPGMW